MINLFKIKIIGRDRVLHDRDLYYTVYYVRIRSEPATCINTPDIRITEFLIYDSEHGFHWIDSIICEPV